MSLKKIVSLLIFVLLLFTLGCKQQTSNDVVEEEIENLEEEVVDEVLEESVYVGNIAEGTLQVKIADELIFENGPDIFDVDPDKDSGVLYDSCLFDDVDEEYFCAFVLKVLVSEEAADRYMAAVKKLDVIEQEDFNYLAEPMVLYFEGQEITRVAILEELVKEYTQKVVIIDHGFGATEDEAVDNAEIRLLALFDVFADVPAEE